MGCKFRRITGGEQGQQVRQIRNGHDRQAVLVGDLLHPQTDLWADRPCRHAPYGLAQSAPGRRGPCLAQ